MKKYENYVSNLNILQKAKEENLENEFIISGIIDKFSIQFELGWKTLKELLKYEGKVESQSGSPRSIIKAAYTIYDFMDEEIWLEMLRARNDMSHIYDGEAARRLVGEILEKYIPEFQKMKIALKEHYGEMLEVEKQNDIRRNL